MCLFSHTLGDVCGTCGMTLCPGGWPDHPSMPKFAVDLCGTSRERERMALVGRSRLGRKTSRCRFPCGFFFLSLSTFEPRISHSANVGPRSGELRYAATLEAMPVDWSTMLDKCLRRVSLSTRRRRCTYRTEQVPVGSLVRQSHCQDMDMAETFPALDCPPVPLWLSKVKLKSLPLPAHDSAAGATASHCSTCWLDTDDGAAHDLANAIRAHTTDALGACERGS